jgi:hypothetical protein
MTHPRRFERFFHSVFTKLLVVIVLAGLCISLLIVGFFVAYRHLAGGALQEHLAMYTGYLINDLGTPPDPERAREIARKTGLAIRYESAGTSWSTNGADRPVNMSRLHIWHDSPGFTVGRHRGRYIAIAQRGEGRFTFEFTGRHADESRAKRLPVIFFTLFILLLLMAYFAIRRILKPVRWLREGVE